MSSVQFAKFLMKIMEVTPASPLIKVGELQEVFNHSAFLEGSKETQKEIMHKSSDNKYQSELDYPWDNYFGIELTPLLKGKDILDLGCLNGGRGIAWYEKYGLHSINGIDVTQVYIDAATQFAHKKDARAEYHVATGEKLPYENSTFDAILSFDVFEHVQDLSQTLSECYRVLKPGGRLFVVFPGFYQPIEHHLSLVTKLPFIHYFFSAETLVRAYYEIMKERGDDAYWYKRKSPELMSWEKGNTINGTTLHKFKQLIGVENWKIIRHSKKPIGSIGRNVSKSKVFKVLSTLFYPLVYIPGVREIFLHRITFILEKPE